MSLLHSSLLTTTQRESQNKKKSDQLGCITNQCTRTTFKVLRRHRASHNTNYSSATNCTMSHSICI